MPKRWRSGDRNRSYSFYRHGFQAYGGPQGRLGAAGELLACYDLLARGYEVFRALSPQAPHDIIVDVGGVLLRVEVKARSRNPNGSLRYLDSSTFDQLRERRPDVIAFVDIVNGAVHYDPPVDIAAKRRLEVEDPAAEKMMEQADMLLSQVDVEIAVSENEDYDGSAAEPLYWRLLNIMDRVAGHAEYLREKVRDRWLKSRAA